VGTTELDGLLRRWRDELAAWAIPEHILAGCDESPWTLPRQTFARRTRRQIGAPEGPSFRRAVEALAPRGTVLDVGAGTGAASLPLAPWATAVTAVDSEEGMLAALDGIAREVGVPVRAVPGRWPDVAPRVEPADVVVCFHVLYNVAELAPFVAALHACARRRVVVELTARHPMSALNPLWRRLHGLDRPAGPTAADAVAVLTALGLNPRVRHWHRPARMEYTSHRELAETTRRRLCLPPDRQGDVEDALRELSADPDLAPYLGAAHRELVTVWWAGAARSR
jgi:SAM-dependent methyltransferase